MRDEKGRFCKAAHRRFNIGERVSGHAPSLGMTVRGTVITVEDPDYDGELTVEVETRYHGTRWLYGGTVKPVSVNRKVIKPTDTETREAAEVKLIDIKAALRMHALGLMDSPSFKSAIEHILEV